MAVMVNQFTKIEIKNPRMSNEVFAFADRADTIGLAWLPGCRARLADGLLKRA